MGTGIFLNVPAHGHVNPTLPIVEELVKRGETIFYFNLEEFRGKIEQTGAEFLPYSFSDPQKRAMTNGNLVTLTKNLLLATEEVMAKNIKDIRELDPDYLIHDSMCPWGKYIAHFLGIKAINTTSTFVFTKETTNKAGAFKKRIMKMVFEEGIGGLLQIMHAKRRLKQKYQVNPGIMDLFQNVEKLNIVFTSTYFQPDGTKLSGPFTFIGPSIFDKKNDVPFFFDKMEGKKLIYISLGTILNDRLDFFQACIKAFSQSNFTVLISIGFQVNRKDLGEIPQNMIIENYLPQIEILKRASLFISHGGMNSVSESLYFGVPLLIYPQQTEQAMIANRVEELGAGICLSENNMTAEKLAENTMYILGNNSFYENAKKIGETFKVSGGYKAGVEAILQYIYNEPKSSKVL
ncbi:glycosyl transferase family 1 [Bacillaceae bacterium Marseille-Q3522]|nr:glycosyl transferase family 1 [Bacillaceae bacterium Marseille-Q3522]